MPGNSAVIGFDLGGTKLSGAVFDREGKSLYKVTDKLDKREGDEVAQLIRDQAGRLLKAAASKEMESVAIGMSVPGIVYPDTGNVWLPNIPGWDNYPLHNTLQSVLPGQEINVALNDDRACSVLGEVWLGKAKRCRDVIFLAVGTGIGAGILANGQVLSGNNGAAGAIGWLAVDRPYQLRYKGVGCFEYHASGDGMAKVARELLNYVQDSKLSKITKGSVTAQDVFEAASAGDELASMVLFNAIECWGIASANLVSLFNPEKIIFGGGVFGPALAYLDRIREEAMKWAQPVSIQSVAFEGTALGQDAAMLGAAFLAWRTVESRHTI